MGSDENFCQDASDSKGEMSCLSPQGAPVPESQQKIQKFCLVVRVGWVPPYLLILGVSYAEKLHNQQSHLWDPDWCDIMPKTGCFCKRTWIREPNWLPSNWRSTFQNKARTSLKTRGPIWVLGIYSFVWKPSIQVEKDIIPSRALANISQHEIGKGSFETFRM